MIDRWVPGPLARHPLVVLLFLSASLLLWHLGSYGLWESTEARYAEIAARMVRSGDWLTPRLNWIAHFEKPPLAYWATGAGMVLFGVSEIGARIGLVVTSVIVLALVYRWAEQVYGGPAAVYALLTLLSAPLFFALSRSVTTDLYLTLWVVLAADAARRGTRAEGTGAQRRGTQVEGTRAAVARGWRLVAWAALGAAFLTKGPVVLLWTALPALAWAGWTGTWGRLRRLLDPVGVMIAALIGFGWPLLMLERHPALLDLWLGRQTVGRMTAPFAGEREPLWFYLPTIAWAAGPWLLPAALELARGLRDRRVGARDAGNAGHNRQNAVRHLRGQQTAYLLCWVLLPLLAFTLFPTKRANYVLPALPALALAAGAWWARVPERVGARGVARALALLAILLGVGLLVASARAEVPAPLLVLGRAAGPAFVLGGAAAWWAAGRGRYDLVFASWLVPLLGLYVLGYAALAQPSVERWFKISRPLAAAIAAERRPGEKIVAWHDWPRAFPFYLEARVVTVTTEGRDTRFEREESWREWVLTADSAVGRFARDGKRTFYVVPRAERDELERTLGVRLTPIAATRRYLVAVDRPQLSRTPAPRAGPRPSRRSGRSREGR